MTLARSPRWPRSCRSARLGRCLVLQPYRAADEQLYTSILRPAIENEMIAVRLKDAAGSQQIYASFFEAVSYSTAIIADISELNENVMYEVGYAHGRGLQPLLFTLDASESRKATSRASLTGPQVAARPRRGAGSELRRSACPLR
jgi:hypothetical protein